MTNLELTEEQTEALIRELSPIIDGDRYPLSPRIVPLKEILTMMRPEPEREPLPASALRTVKQGQVREAPLVLWQQLPDNSKAVLSPAPSWAGYGRKANQAISPS